MDHGLVKPAQSGGYIYEVWTGVPNSLEAKPRVVGHSGHAYEAVEHVRKLGVPEERLLKQGF